MPSLVDESEVISIELEGGMLGASGATRLRTVLLKMDNRKQPAPSLHLRLNVVPFQETRCYRHDNAQVDLAQLFQLFAATQIPIIGVASGAFRGTGLALLAACDEFFVAACDTTFTFDLSYHSSVPFTWSSISVLQALIASKVGSTIANSWQASLPVMWEYFTGLVDGDIKEGDPPVDAGLQLSSTNTPIIQTTQKQLVLGTRGPDGFSRQSEAPNASEVPMPLELIPPLPSLCHPGFQLACPNASSHSASYGGARDVSPCSASAFRATLTRCIAGDDYFEDSEPGLCVTATRCTVGDDLFE